MLFESVVLKPFTPRISGPIWNRFSGVVPALHNLRAVPVSSIPIRMEFKTGVLWIASVILLISQGKVAASGTLLLWNVLMRL